jgi:hypothetical protein
MPEISRFLGIIIAIKELTTLEGKLPPKVLGLVIEWASKHQKELMENWHLAEKLEDLKTISPLE